MEVGSGNSLYGIATQGENVFDTGLAQCRKHLLDVGARCAHAGQVRHHRKVEIVFGHTGDIDRARAVSAAACRIRHRHERRVERGKLGCKRMGRFDGQLAFRGEDFERHRKAVTFEHLRNLHDRSFLVDQSL